MQADLQQAGVAGGTTGKCLTNPQLDQLAACAKSTISANEFDQKAAIIFAFHARFSNP
jgi:hypothetical protein